MEVVGISTDPQDVLDRFRAERKLPFALVADPAARIAGDYGARWPILKVARRVTYLVGRDRRIALAFRSERQVAAHAAKVLEAAAR